MQITLHSRNNHVDVICHNNAGMDFQSFFFLAIPETFQQNFPVQVPGKHINPFDNRISYKINTFGIVEFVFGTHKLKVKIFLIETWHKSRHHTYHGWKTCASVGSHGESLRENSRPTAWDPPTGELPIPISDFVGIGNPRNCFEIKISTISGLCL